MNKREEQELPVAVYDFWHPFRELNIPLDEQSNQEIELNQDQMFENCQHLQVRDSKLDARS